MSDPNVIETEPPRAMGTSGSGEKAIPSHAQRRPVWMLAGPRRTLATTSVNHRDVHAKISTVQLATLGVEPEWETVVSARSIDAYVARYASRAAALAGHRLLVIRVLRLAYGIRPTPRKRRLCDRSGHPRTIEALEHTGLCLRCGAVVRIAKR